jgi:hypothetical protein
LNVFEERLVGCVARGREETKRQRERERRDKR